MIEAPSAAGAGSVLSLAGGGLRAKVRPAEGGRIVSLRGAGREWLVPDRSASQARLTGPLTAPGRVGLGPGFVRPGMGGWDECLPTIAPCTLDGRRFPDHGEVWSRAWVVRAVGLGRIELEVALEAVPLVLRRSVIATARGLRLDYELESTARVPQPVLWSAHPQFAANGVRLETDPASETLVGADLRPVSWPGAAVTDLPDGSGIKLFAPVGTRVSRAELTHVSGARLRMSWDPDQLPYLGLWWDNRQCASVPAVAIEPTTGLGDDAAQAAGAGLVRVVGPRESLRWHIDLSVHAPGSRP